MKIQLPVEPLVDIGKGKPIVLLHGFSHNLNSWARVIEEFSSTHRILVPRPPLQSNHVSEERLNDFAEYLHCFIEKNQLEEVTIFGNSLGSNVALLFAWKYPKKIEKLVVSGNSGFLETIQEDSSDETSKSTIAEEYEIFFPENTLADNTFNVIMSESETLTGPDNCIDQCYSLTEILSSISIPVLLVWGLQDTVTPPIVALATNHHLPSSDLIFLDNCGHVPMKEQPVLFNRHVRNFLN